MGAKNLTRERVCGDVAAHVANGTSRSGTLKSSAALMLFASIGSAFSGEASVGAQANSNLPQRVEVVGGAVSDDRREANAAKIVVTHDDLVRFGDATISDALQRVPGVSVLRSQGKDVEIRLRGLGSGYTQILVDGTPVPAGFSIESLSPDLIDRIEILKSPTADLSTQAIAGTINIVLKRAMRSSTRSAKLGVSAYDAQSSVNASVDYAGRMGGLGWGLSATASTVHDRWPATSQNSAVVASGEPDYARTTAIDERNRQTSVAVSPTAEWKLDDDSSVRLNGWLQSVDNRYSNSDRRSGVTGEPPQFFSDVLVSDTSGIQGRMTGQLKARVGAEGRLESKLIISGGHRNTDAVVTGDDAGGDLLLRRTVHSIANDRSGSLVGKLSESLGENHTLSVGWDGQLEHRFENRIQRETSPLDDYPTQDLDEDYTARIHRLALFAQDEWAISPQLGAYFGLRWEGLKTRTEGRELAPVSVQSSVLSPVVQFVWKVPETKSDQVRVSLGRTYKAPTTRQLIPRRWVVTDNTATTPNFQGNPELQPELAWGLDIGYERYFGADGFVGLSVFGRRISNVILPQVERTNGAWVETPENSGSANVEGIEFEAKGKLRMLLPDAPDVDLRSGFTRSWSQVEQVPGPGNRLARQPQLTASVGADWRTGTAWTVGASYSFEQGGYSRNTVTTATVSAYGRLLDFYGLWEADKSRRLRLSVTNALAPTASKRAVYDDGEIRVVDDNRTKSFVAFRAQFELTF